MKRLASVGSHCIGLCLLLGVAKVQAGEIFRCEIDGKSVFTDSPRACPGGSAARMAADGRAVDKVICPQPSKGHAAPSLGQGAVPPARAEASATTLACTRLTDAAATRQCLRDERRPGLRRLGALRLDAMSRSMADLAGYAQRSNGVLAVSKKDIRPPTWCESFFGDVIAKKNLEAIDDETVPLPQGWLFPESESRAAQLLPDLMDPNFKEWLVDGSKVASGYLLLRWRGTDVVTLQTTTSCIELDGQTRCPPHRYAFIVVYESSTSRRSCDLTLVGRAYWPNWVNLMTPIRLAAPTSQ